MGSVQGSITRRLTHFRTPNSVLISPPRIWDLSNVVLVRQSEKVHDPNFVLISFGQIEILGGVYD